MQRFGSALNAHTHLHCCVTDGVFSLEPAGTLHFHTAADLDAAMVSAVQRRIRSRVLRLAVRHGALTPEVAADLARWGHGGRFSLHAGQTELALTPLELLDRLAALMPWPRRHRHHYAGVFAPHAKLRARDPPRTRRRVRLRVRSVPVVGLERRSVRAELPLRSDPELTRA